VLFALLLLAYLLPGLVGHDPWKTEDATGIGIVHQMLEHGNGSCRIWRANRTWRTDRSTTGSRR